jgi:hypothetical protein
VIKSLIISDFTSHSGFRVIGVMFSKFVMFLRDCYPDFTISILSVGKQDLLDVGPLRCRSASRLLRSIRCWYVCSILLRLTPICFLNYLPCHTVREKSVYGVVFADRMKVIAQHKLQESVKKERRTVCSPFRFLRFVFNPSLDDERPQKRKRLDVNSSENGNEAYSSVSCFFDI